MKHPSGVLSLIAVLAMLVLGSVSVVAREATPGARPAAGGTDAGLYETVLTDQRESVVAETEGELSLYTIEAEIDPGTPDSNDAGFLGGSPATVVGSLHLRYVNDTGSELTELHFRLYPNDGRYGEGGIELETVTVDGHTVEPEFSVSDTVATLPLEESLPSSASVEVELEFTTVVVEQVDPLSNMLTTSPQLGSISLAHWYPLVAGYDPETGWLLDPVSVNGDLVFSNTALYRATLTAPEDVVVVTSGSLTSESAIDGMVEREYVTGPAREFTVVVDDDFASMEQVVDGTTVAVWYNPGQEAGATEILRAGVQSLAVFNDLFGAYPFDGLDLVELEMFGPSGIEYSQLVGLDTSLFDPPGALEGEGYPSRFAEYITAHEVAHQWWYGLVGNNHYDHAFIDEGLAEASTIIYFEHQYGAEVAVEQMRLNLVPYIGEYAADYPSDDYPDGLAYFDAVYGKGGMAFLALSGYLGADVFEAGIREYVAQYRFGVASPDDLRATLERVSGQNLDEVWRALFETTGTEVSIPLEIATPAA